MYPVLPGGSILTSWATTSYCVVDSRQTGYGLSPYATSPYFRLFYDWLPSLARFVFLLGMHYKRNTYLKTPVTTKATPG